MPALSQRKNSRSNNPAPANNKKPTELSRRFTFWADTPKRIEKTIEVVRGWIKGLPDTDSNKVVLVTLVTQLQHMAARGENALELWVKLSEAKFTPKKPAPGGVFAKGCVIKYRSEYLKKGLDLDGDPELWAGEYVVTHVERSKSGNVYLRGHSKNDKSFPFGPIPSYQFKIVA